MNHFADEPVRIVKPKGAAVAASDSVALARERLRVEPDARQEEMLRATLTGVRRGYVERKGLVLAASPTEMAMQSGIKPRGDGTSTASLLLPMPARPGRSSSHVNRWVKAWPLRLRLDHDEDPWLLSKPCGKRSFLYNAWMPTGAVWTKLQAAVPLDIPSRW